MTDPYKVLGVSPEDSDERIKQAYRELVRKYHPDKYANTDLAEMATEKMKEVNAAYEEIQRRRKAGETGGTYGGAYGGQSHSQSYGGSGAGGNATFSAVRAHINNGSIEEAYRLLSTLPESERNAEWNFLMGCVHLRRGSMLDAQKYIDLACAQNPYNAEYRSVRDRLRVQTGAYSGGYRTSPVGAGGCSSSDICCSMLCADSCCECMGGDLIGCC